MEKRTFTHPLPRREIEKGFELLIGENRLFGAELNIDIIKKEHTGKKFLVKKLPSRRKLLSRWFLLFRDLVSPADFLALLSAKIQEFEHREKMLLVGKDRIIYDTQIVHAGEHVGEMTLFFLSEMDRNFGLLDYLRGRRRRIVYIDHIRLSQQSSGYASSLFRHYEELFRDLGFHQFRLSASLSVGKYYWAKEGFDCLDKEQFRRMKEGLRDIVKERGFPVEEIEIDRLNHVYDIALFKRELKVPAYRDPEGYYSLDKDEEHREEKTFPLGKAFLLSSNPWDGYKIIYTNTPRRTGLLYSPGYLNHRPRAGSRRPLRRERQHAQERHGKPRVFVGRHADLVPALQSDLVIKLQVFRIDPCGQIGVPRLLGLFRGQHVGRQLM